MRNALGVGKGKEKSARLCRESKWFERGEPGDDAAANRVTEGQTGDAQWRLTKMEPRLRCAKANGCLKGTGPL
jgi:hypothetical protein